MFDLTRLHTLNLDALRPWRIYTLRQALVTRDGHRCEAGSSFRFEHAIVDVPARRAEIHGLGPLNEAMVFDSRDDAHRQWFGDTGHEWRPGSWVLPGAAPTEPPSQADDGPAPEGEALVAALRQRGHAEAADVLAGRRSSSGWGGARDDADVLAACARVLAGRAGRVAPASAPPLARAVADEALTLYHAWMSQATSGGEGAAMQYEIARPLAEMRQLVGLPAVRRSRLP
jgi:hypothetical protein